MGRDGSLKSGVGRGGGESDGGWGVRWSGHDSESG